MKLPKQLQNVDFRFIKIKDGKIPLEKNWQNTNNYSYTDSIFIEYLKTAKGYGVLCGKGNLAVIDADEKEIELAVTKNLPKTFVVQTGSGGYHYYYIIKDLENKIVLKDDKKKHYGEVQSVGSQVIGSGSVHPNGELYKTKIVTQIAEITQQQLRQALIDFIPDKKVKWGESNDIDISKLAGQIHGMKRIGEELQGPHPIHGSTGGMNFTINTEKNLWHCFRCNSGGDALSLVGILEKKIKCDEKLEGKKFTIVKKIAKDKYGIEQSVKEAKVVDKRKHLDLKHPPKNLEALYEKLRKWLYITDTQRIDLVLAAILSNQAKNTKPIWVFIIGESGDAKSEILGALKDYPGVKPIDQITPNTLATGKTYKNKKVPDLGEELQDASHILCFSDLASLKSLNTDNKNEIWGQFRELYDGRINKMTGNDTKAQYNNCHVTLIACTTPDIKAEYAIHNQLGTREFSYDVQSSRTNDGKKMQMAMKHMEREAEMHKDLQEAVQSYLEHRKFNPKVKVDDELREWMMTKCKELAVFRAAGSWERQTNELRGAVTIEVPTRLIQQINLLYKSLMSLEAEYPVEKFKSIVENIVKSSGDTARHTLFHFMKQYPEQPFKVQTLHEELNYGKNTIKKQCEALVWLGYLRRLMSEPDEGSIEQKRGLKKLEYVWSNKPKITKMDDYA